VVKKNEANVPYFKINRNKMGKDKLSKSLPQKTHRERSQPSKSKSFLERKRDWKLRSTDFKVKNTILSNLKKKIFNRNPDEFTHEMISHKSTSSGNLVKRDNANAVFDNETLLLLKSQDLAYIKLMNHLNLKKISKISGGLGTGDETGIDNRTQSGTNTPASTSNHIIYVDPAETNEKDFDLASHLDTAPEFLSRKSNRPRISSNNIINTTDQIDKATLKVGSG
jgi:U3 small nucleolar RNA-associated protein 11